MSNLLCEIVPVPTKRGARSSAEVNCRFVARNILFEARSSSTSHHKIDIVF